MYYVCHDHRLAYPKPRQVNGHRANNRNLTGEECNVGQEEEVPEGYTVKGEPPPPKSSGGGSDGAGANGSGQIADTVVETPARQPAPTGGGAAVATAEMPSGYADDSRAVELNRQLTAVGVPVKEVNTILNGYVGMDAFQTDPNALHRWLETNIRNRLLHSYIPMIVNELFQFGPAQTSAPHYPNPANPGYAGYPQPGPSYGAPVYNPGGAPPRMGYEPTPWWVERLLTKERETAEPSAESKAVLDKLETVSKRLDESEAERKKERAEQEENQRARLIQARFSQLEERLVKLTEAIAAGPSDSKTSDMAELRAEMREMGNRVTDAQFDKLELMIQNLNDRMLTGGEQVGRTTEDVVSAIGPVVLEKIDAAGKRIIQEVKEAREHALPSASDRRVLEAEPVPKAEPLGVDEIVELAEAENAVLDLADELRDGPPAPAEGEAVDLLEGAPEAQEQTGPEAVPGPPDAPTLEGEAIPMPGAAEVEGDGQSDAISRDPETAGPVGTDQPPGERDHGRSPAATGSGTSQSDAGGGVQGN